MSCVCYASDQMMVFDDVLSHENFSALHAHLNSLEYRSVHASAWRKVWRLHDGNPLTTAAGWFLTEQEAQRGNIVFPTGTPIDRLVEAIADNAERAQHLIGSSPADWKRFSFASWIYPPGSGLSLHQDGHVYTGAYVFFAHRQWRTHWGGQLIVLDPETAAPEGSANCFFDDDAEAARVMVPGIGRVIFARPNRLVLLSPTAQHLITRVDGNAGQYARVSIAGFFHKT
jgi:hypothetical protein